MSEWAAGDLDRIGDADELQISSRRPDGTDRPFVTIWAVRSGDAIYVRSAYGADNPWFRRAVRAGSGRIKAGGIDRAVAFARIAPDDTRLQDELDAVYHAKYDRYGVRYVSPVVGPASYQATLRVDPR